MVLLLPGWNLFLSSSRIVLSSAQQTPAFEKVGAYALYTAIGGSIPFFEGVSGNFSYVVTAIHPNATMSVTYEANVSGGSESDLQPAYFEKNLTDNANDPKFFPIVLIANLTSGSTVEFQNITCAFVKDAAVSVPAGRFNTAEFQGKDANGTVATFWFDQSTGLEVEASQSVNAFQLVKSNIAVPLESGSTLSSALPFIATFVVGWAGAGLLFYAVRRHYIRKSKELQKVKEAAVGGRKSKTHEKK
jgi:hypothetical protein